MFKDTYNNLNDDDNDDVLVALLYYTKFHVRLSSSSHELVRLSLFYRDFLAIHSCLSLDFVGQRENAICIFQVGDYFAFFIK